MVCICSLPTLSLCKKLLVLRGILPLLTNHIPLTMNFLSPNSSLYFSFKCLLFRRMDAKMSTNLVKPSVSRQKNSIVLCYSKTSIVLHFKEFRYMMLYIIVLAGDKEHIIKCQVRSL
ncbi:unnamed protein product [Nezara viridula]|uniref:Uncharacterized protein n=1 Tax=Nezara viridula TaxID=85310 RepID=A0A9P0MY86_NEZVI|nr:unnamed protein product [Nezara viridula]